MNRFVSISIWVAFLLGLTFVFSWLLEKQRNPNQSNITQITSAGYPEVVLKRNKYGHYVATGEINAERVVFFLDTGATAVVVPSKIADRLGLERGHKRTSETANGSIEVYATTLDEVALGGIVLKNVRASINPYFEADEILLGMSFLKHLELVQKGDELRLKVPEE